MPYDISIPSFLATVWDMNASFTEVLDKITRQPIKDHVIVFADAKDGYFVAWKGELKNREFYIVNSKDFVIRHYIDKEKTDYYDSDEIDYENLD